MDCLADSLKELVSGKKSPENDGNVYMFYYFNSGILIGKNIIQGEIFPTEVNSFQNEIRNQNILLKLPMFFQMIANGLQATCVGRLSIDVAQLEENWQFKLKVLGSILNQDTFSELENFQFAYYSCSVKFKN